MTAEGSVRRRGVRRGWARWGLLLAAIGVLAAGCDWTQAGYAGRSFYNPLEPALTAETVGSLAERYAIDLPPGTGHDPIVVGGAVVVGSLDPATGAASVTAYDGDTGDLRWATTVRDDVERATDVIAVAGRLLVATSGEAGVEVAALDLSSGSVVWERTLPSSGPGTAELDPQLATASGKVLVGRRPSWAARTCAIDSARRRRRDEPWDVHGIPSTSETRITVAQDRIVAVVHRPPTDTVGPSTTLYDGADGSRIWNTTEVYPSLPRGVRPGAGRTLHRSCR